MKPKISRAIPLAFASLCLAAGLSVQAAATRPGALDVTVDDLVAAGVAGVTAVSPVPDRFQPPMKYFRSPERIPDAQAKKDCDDCGDLIGVYAADIGTKPSWAEQSPVQILVVGARYQVRAFIAAKKRVVTVTAASEATARRISAHLIGKFSK